MGTNVPTWIVLAIAVVIGVLPVHECAPSCGQGGGWALLGSHAHDGHEHGECGHRHDVGDEPADTDHEPGSCCTHTASVNVLPASKVAPPSSSWSSFVLVPAAVAVASAPRDTAPASGGLLQTGPPPGVAGVVLRF